MGPVARAAPARVLVADDHAPTRFGVRMALEDDGFQVCADVATARAAVDAALDLKPDIALLDVHMPGNGVDAARAISGALPDCAVVMLTVSRDDADLFEALRAGARGYLLKDIAPDRLPAALWGVLNGEAALPRNLVARVVAEFQGRDEAQPGGGRRGALAKLTSREWQVLDFMGQGMSNAEIAARLFIAPVTVRTHTAAILRKLQVPDRQAAVDLIRKD